jgi:hypothetical protein
MNYLYGDIYVDGRIILKSISEKQGMKAEN